MPQVVFSESLSPGQGRNNAVSPMNVGIEDFLKEHKTLNVNMNTESPAINCVRESQEMNNKINFDSEKFRHQQVDASSASTPPISHFHSCFSYFYSYLQEHSRPPTTIENLNSVQNGDGEKVHVKRTKCTNVETGGGMGELIMIVSHGWCHGLK